MTLHYLSLFSGIGGFDLGFDQAGMQCAGQVEIDPYCQKVLAKHWPDVKRMSDIREVKGDEFGTVDVICGGFPCQPHSLAGQRKGAADDRDLWPEYRRLIAAMRPAWVVGENVPGIGTTILDSVLSDLEHLAYTATAIIVPACAFGAPHRRERVFIVAYTDTERRNGWAGQFGTGRRGESTDGYRWEPEPGICRVAHGIPARVDRLRALGNAVVPQVAEWLGRRIMEATP